MEKHETTKPTAEIEIRENETPTNNAPQGAGPQEGQPAEAQEDFIVTPYTMVNNTGKEIDYQKLIQQFGTRPITQELLEYFKKVTNSEPHIHLKRGTLPLRQKYSFLTAT